MENLPEIKQFELAQPLNMEAVTKRRQSIVRIVKEMMVKDTHFGTIPGTKEPTLYKPGAELLANLFGLRSKFDIQRLDYDNGHREYQVVSTFSLASGEVISQGMGVSSTLEKKHRWRYADPEPTEIPIPKDYWNLRKEHGRGFADSLLPPDHSVTKIDGTWYVCKRGSKVENPDIADCYNTCLKMAKKRSYNDGIITALAASEFFVQDVDDLTIDPLDSDVEPLKAMAKNAERDAVPTGNVVYAIPYKSSEIDSKATINALSKAGFKPDKTKRPWQWRGTVEMEGLEAYRIFEAPKANTQMQVEPDLGSFDENRAVSEGQVELY